MSIIKMVRRSINTHKLVSSDTLNVRLANEYDLDTIEQQIVSAGGVTDDLTVEPIPDRAGYYTVLKGNRRTRACVNLLSRDSTSQELKDAIGYLQCQVVDQPITERQRLEIILDHGRSLGLSRLATVMAVWRLDAQMLSPVQIGELMYYQLAQYTGNLAKLADPALRDPTKRKKTLATWFRGTLDSKILLANRLGEYVRQQFILSTKAEDKSLADGETIEVVLTGQDRLKALDKARNADLSADGWTMEAGGESFNALLADYREIDAGRKDKESNTRPTVKALLDYANRQFKSAPIKAVLKVAAGEQGAGVALQAMDAAIYRWQLVSEILANNLTRIVDPHVAEFVATLLSDGPAAEVETSLSLLFAADPEPAAEPTAPDA